MPKCDFNKVAKQITLRHGCSPVNLLHIFRTPFLKNTSEWLLPTLGDLSLVIFMNCILIKKDCGQDTKDMFRYFV